MFDLFAWPQIGEKVLLGQLNIIYTDLREVADAMPGAFDRLDENFYTLGLDLQYYQNLRNYFPNEHLEILRALRDIAVTSALEDEIEEDTVRRQQASTTLFRFSSSRAALKDARKLLGIRRQETSTSEKRFEFTTELPARKKNPEVSHTLRIPLDFEDDGSGLHRINVLVGENGTGKTQVLVRLANSLSGWQQKQGTFRPLPDFKKIIAVSYSAFDEFDRPPAENYSYVYCGIQTQLDKDRTEHLDDRIGLAMNRIALREREGKLKEVVEQVFPQRPDLLREVNKKLTLKGYSSGEQVILYVLVELMAHLEERSLVVFDEPENHLHPSLLSRVIRSIHDLLQEYDSYALMATHSPILLQEIPAKRVRVIRRSGNRTVVRTLEKESFGEDYSTINEAVFGLPYGSANFLDILERLLETHSAAEVREFFPHGIPLSVEAMLRSKRRG